MDRFVEGSNLRACRTYPRTVRPAVVAHSVDGRVVDDGAVIHIGDVHVGDVVHRAVVLKLPIVPIAALISAPGISMAVIDAAVVSDVRPPIPLKEAKYASEKSPVSGRPESALIRRLGPRAGHPSSSRQAHNSSIQASRYSHRRESAAAPHRAREAAAPARSQSASACSTRQGYKTVVRNYRSTGLERRTGPRTDRPAVAGAVPAQPANMGRGGGCLCRRGLRLSSDRPELPGFLR